MRKQRLDVIASSTRQMRPARMDVTITDEIEARPGVLLAVEVLGHKAVYGSVEDPAGRLVELDEHDVLACVLGERRALLGYAGRVPEKVRPGDVLHILNMGGVVGECTSINPTIGSPREVRVLGGILRFPHLGERRPVRSSIADGAIPHRDTLGKVPPVVCVIGTCMNAGKTCAAARIVRYLAKTREQHVVAAKLTGVSLRRDMLAMQDRGARTVVDFADAGVPSTAGEETPPIAKGVLHRLAQERPDAIVVELGDGLLGEYGVQDLLRDDDFRGAVKAWVLCANDAVGAWALSEIMREEYGLAATVVTGPATDNATAREAIEAFGLPAFNARTQEAEFVECVVKALNDSAA